MANKTVYQDNRFNHQITGNFFLLYWLIPIVCMIGIPVTAYVLAFQIPLEISAYGFSTRLGVIIALMCFAIALGVHALAGFVIQAIKDFPMLIASISVDDDGQLVVVPFVGKPRLYDTDRLIESTCEPCNDPFWLRIYRYSTYQNKYTCKLTINNDEWLISKRTMDSQDTLIGIRSIKTQLK